MITTKSTKNTFLLRVPVMKSNAMMAESVSLDLPRRDIDVCVLLVLKENAAKKVGTLQFITCCCCFFITVCSKFIIN